MQLKTSSTVAYAEFIRYGYPNRIDFEDLIKACRPIEDKLKDTYVWPSNFHTKVLLHIGLTQTDFKMGKDVIFFRSNKVHLAEIFLSECKTALTLKENMTDLGTHVTDSSIQKKRKPK